jgi:hypothetical protein
MKLMTDGRKALLTGIALVGCLGFAFNAQAQTCTISNWAGGPTNLSDADTGTQGGSNRRYGGPCGLQVDIDGTERYVSDDSPQSETTYIARFYAFLDNAGSDPMVIFAADDGADDQIQVWYNFPNAGDLTLRVYDNGGGTNDLTESGIGSGWHSIEFAWDAAATSDIRFSVDGAADLTASPDTSGLAIVNAHLGNVNGAGNGTSVDFDDFDSRRIERPGRLLLADANGDGVISGADNTALMIERLGGTFAAGQPDCNEDGTINGADNTCLLILRLAP